MSLYTKQFKVAYFCSVMEQYSFQAFLQYEALQMFHTYICDLSWFTFLALIDKNKNNISGLKYLSKKQTLIATYFTKSLLSEQLSGFFLFYPHPGADCL